MMINVITKNLIKKENFIVNNNKKAIVLIEFTLMFYWTVAMSKSSANYIVYLITGMLGILCLGTSFSNQRGSNLKIARREIRGICVYDTLELPEKSVRIP